MVHPALIGHQCVDRCRTAAHQSAVSPLLILYRFQTFCREYPLSVSRPHSKVTPILYPFRQTTRHGSFSLSSGTMSVNVAGRIALKSESSIAAPVTERSRMVQGVLSPP